MDLELVRARTIRSIRVVDSCYSYIEIRDIKMESQVANEEQEEGLDVGSANMILKTPAKQSH